MLIYVNNIEKNFIKNFMLIYADLCKYRRQKLKQICFWICFSQNCYYFSVEIIN